MGDARAAAARALGTSNILEKVKVGNLKQILVSVLVALRMMYQYQISILVSIIVSVSVKMMCLQHNSLVH